MLMYPGEYRVPDTMPGNYLYHRPSGYPGRIRLKAGALTILTGSGGIQKEMSGMYYQKL